MGGGMTSALVTGCAGFIGSHLTESLLSDGDAVIGVDCFNENYARGQKLENLRRSQAWDSFEFVPIDLARGDLHDLVEQVEVVFHLAAEPGVRASWGTRFESYLRNNLAATQQLLEAAKAWPDKRFVFASSSSVYGDAEAMPTAEDALPRPFSPYGVTKLAAEHMARLYHANYGVDAVCLRYFSVYGPRQRPDMAFNIFCHAALTGASVRVFGDGSQTRDFTYVEDVVSATRRAAVADGVVGRVYNVGGGSQVSVATALRKLEALCGRRIAVDHRPRERGDVRHSSADTTLAARDLGFNPEMSFDDGLDAELGWVVERLSRAGSPSRA
jgi:UDP-glucuronate 4-epimerase